MKMSKICGGVFRKRCRADESAFKSVRLLLLTIVTLIGIQTARAQINCSQTSCTSLDQQTINGFQMFDETNFDPVLDGAGNQRQFWVHIPQTYDVINGIDQKVPSIFAFHGAGENRAAMLDGKWGDHFDQDIAIVIPLGLRGTCSPDPKRIWMYPGWGEGTIPANCSDPSLQQRYDDSGNPIIYWDASMAGAFRDVVFVENLRAVLLSSFPKLNPNKVYATGFSNGGTMSNTLLCYRSSEFRGFSVVGMTLFGDKQRGDYDGDGNVETDPNSLLATCGKSRWDTGYATGLSNPQIWGYGISIPAIFPVSTPVYRRVTKPYALFVGDHDPNFTQAEIDDTSLEIRRRNNLKNPSVASIPYSDSQADNAETSRFTWNLVDDAGQRFSAFRLFLIERTGGNQSAGHAIPDITAPSGNLSTRDYDYTTETINFFEIYSDLNLNP